MIELEEFDKLVRKHFHFLETDFGYECKGSENIPFMFFVKYVKDFMMVSVGLAYRHDYIEVYIFDKIHLYTPTTQNYKHSVNIFQLVRIKKGKATLTDEEAENLMPSTISYDESLERFAILLKEYGKEVLTGKKWIRNEKLVSRFWMMF